MTKSDHQLGGLVGRVFALRLEGQGLIPGLVIPKTTKMVPDVFLLGTNHQGMDLMSAYFILAPCPGGVLIHQAASRYRNRR